MREPVADPDGNRDSYCDCNCNSNGYGHSNGYSELHAQVSTYAAAAPDSGTSTVTSHATLYRLGTFLAMR